MNREKLDIENTKNNSEKLEKKAEDNPEQAEKNIVESTEKTLEGLNNNDKQEEEVVTKIAEKAKESDPDSQEKIATGGFLSSLGEKVKKNKLLRAALVGLSLYSANPAFASGLEGALNKSEAVESVGQSQEKNSDLSQFRNLPESRRKDFEQIFASAPAKAKEIILDELKNGTGLNKKDLAESSGREDPDLLTIQQQTIDLQNKGEMALRRKGGVILPFDAGHSKKPGIEYTNNEIAENGGKQKITIENASENQIRAWVDYSKNPDRYRKNKAE